MLVARKCVSSTWMLALIAWVSLVSCASGDSVSESEQVVGRDSAAEVVPDGYELALANGLTVSEGLTEYGFTLRQGLEFSDGVPLTSRDVKWSWGRALGLGAETSRVWRVLGPIVGAKAILGRGGDLSGVQVIDDRRFTVRLERPFVNIPLHLSDPIAFVVSRANAETWPGRSASENMPSLVFPYRSDHEVTGAGPLRLLAGSLHLPEPLHQLRRLGGRFRGRRRACEIG